MSGKKNQRKGKSDRDDSMLMSSDSSSVSQKALCDEVLNDISKLDVQIDPNTIVAIALVVDKLLDKKLHAQTSDIDKAMADKISSLEKSLSDLSDKYNKLKTSIIPAIASHVSNVTNQLALRDLELETHRRKWNLILHGLDGDEGEAQHKTRESVMKFAKEKLKLQDTNIHLAACHRLSRKKNAGIIVRFCDLSQRDLWMFSTKNLHGTNISLSPDLPPKVRPIKNAVMLHRKSLDQDARKKSKVRYLPQWPFIELKLDDKNTFRPPIAIDKIAEDHLGIKTLLNLAMA